jgi:hypothetical protein
MSSHKKLDNNTLDLSLRRSLKNWVARKQPPEEGKARLLRAAAQESSPKASKMTGMMYLAFNDNISDIYLERFRISPLYSLQPGSLGLSSSKSMV